MYTASKRLLLSGWRVIAMCLFLEQMFQLFSQAAARSSLQHAAPNFIKKLQKCEFNVNDFCAECRRIFYLSKADPNIYATVHAHAHNKLLLHFKRPIWYNIEEDDRENVIGSSRLAPANPWSVFCPRLHYILSGGQSCQSSRQTYFTLSIGQRRECSFFQ